MGARAEAPDPFFKGAKAEAPKAHLEGRPSTDEIIKMIKEKIGEDGYLGMLHALLMMDDTVILATSRVMCYRKLKILYEYCSEYGMVINEKKTKFFVINGSEMDKEPFIIDTLAIRYYPKYLYLGAWFTDVGTWDSVLGLHVTSSTPSVHKFALFCAANTTMPFQYKQKVFNAALTASLLCSSESWLTSSVKCIEQLYNKLVKCLLGVRSTTPSSLCLVELDLNTCQNEILKKRKSILRSRFLNIDDDQPFHFVYALCRRENTPCFRSLSRCLGGEMEGLTTDLLKQQINDKPQNASKFVTYRSKLNVGLDVHEIFKKCVYVPDYLRISFTKLRLMSHNLKIETGRWSRLPRESRVCNCNNLVVQDECHVLLDCSLSQHLRETYSQLDFSSIDHLLNDRYHLLDLCKFINEVLTLFSGNSRYY